MKFTRVSKDTVNCIITEDDMDEQGIKLEDLFEKKKEAMDFLHKVMEKATEEVNYTPSGSYTPMQITVLPDHSISLMLSENSDEAFTDILKNLTEKVGLRFSKSFLEELGDSNDEERISRLSEYLQGLKDIAEPGKKSRKSKIVKKDSSVSTKKTDKTNRIKELEKLDFNDFVFSFDNMRTVIEFSSTVSRNIKVDTKLYKNSKSGKFYMIFSRANEKPKKFASLFSTAYEFGKYTTVSKTMIAHIDESSELIIGEKAIEKLKKLNK
ncbi:MAG: adaptor protein MecA [Butyrivibrio sp.]|nr:adaptor protein MecA [Butyrivibrio sp.]